ncbi:hypothetical protein AAFF_G00172440 [Aldrovandia affinis]|uniref:Uncharacterized protein n=1 Tax=Aldrovandia affinis TaxID=143900 RepID=A0AAD7WW73_9TELE|nr:hypothetical protein AAFF_G00172440 [Aldrovandia affinis]
MPDLGIDRSLLVYSGLNSTAVLQDYSGQLRQHPEINANAYTKDVATALGGFTSIPNAVGLSALLISIVIELAFAFRRSEPSEDAAGLLRRVFAEEKSSAVRDLLHEYVNRYGMYLHDEKRMLEETQRLEHQLSAQLTRLRNSMLLDGHVSSRALKQWVNGAAFHAQMVIHIARLGEGDSAPPRAVITRYRTEAKKLLSRYKEYKAPKFWVQYSAGLSCQKSARRKRLFGAYTMACTMCDSELGTAVFLTEPHRPEECNNGLVEAYLDHMFSVSDQIPGMEKYFSELDINLDELIAQHGTFHVI